jgi:hypothetical protein
LILLGLDALVRRNRATDYQEPVAGSHRALIVDHAEAKLRQSAARSYLVGAMGSSSVVGNECTSTKILLPLPPSLPDLRTRQ